MFVHICTRRRQNNWSGYWTIILYLHQIQSLSLEKLFKSSTETGSVLQGNVKSLAPLSPQRLKLPKTSIWRRPAHSTVAHLSDWTGGGQWQPNTFNHWAPPAVRHPERNPSHSSECNSQRLVSSTFVFHDLKKSNKTNCSWCPVPILLCPPYPFPLYLNPCWNWSTE